ncbi:predicted protein [Sclerotinia sclerotiorum 1980 UF-70]|uniref:Uncharacterized protein n=1 Tax=Sclerotinia sclerotiorum (strain ATCC 18683 / 1980 / Ss-1) TaxID=665079 RepID=A7ECB4_SCLS1|nr:predicted protein [Sclerotinia sclerotiorum 1980 UF-70]EDO00093.1 predicted protein [Sclerotinia sclerotiorum 1980 UF-70]
MSTTLTTFPFEVLPIFEEVLVLEAVETPKIRCDLAALQFKFNHVQFDKPTSSKIVTSSIIIDLLLLLLMAKPEWDQHSTQYSVGLDVSRWSVMLVRTQIVSHPEASKACRYSCCQPLIGKARMILKLDSFLT